jgi:hypothetical protein
MINIYRRGVGSAKFNETLLAATIEYLKFYFTVLVLLFSFVRFLTKNLQHHAPL